MELSVYILTMHLLFYCPVPKDILNAALIFKEEEKLSELRIKNGL